MAYQDYNKADKELNDVYKEFYLYKSDAAFINNLKASQRIMFSSGM